MFSFLSPDVVNLVLLGASGAVPVFGYRAVVDRALRRLAARRLAAHPLQHALGATVRAPRWPSCTAAAKLVIIYTVASVAGFLLSSFAGAYLSFVPIPMLRGARVTVGASAAIFGLFGAMVYYGRRTGSSVVHGQAMSYALTLGLMGFLMPGIDNYAHLGGFAGGYYMARLLDPLKPERTDHMVAAFVCLAATALAVIVSVVDGLLRFAP